MWTHSRVRVCLMCFTDALKCSVSTNFTEKNTCAVTVTDVQLSWRADVFSRCFVYKKQLYMCRLWIQTSALTESKSRAELESVSFLRLYWHGTENGNLAQPHTSRIYIFSWHQGCFCKASHLHERWGRSFFFLCYKYPRDNMLLIFEYVLFFRSVLNNWLCNMPLMAVLPAGCCKMCHLFTKSTQMLSVIRVLTDKSQQS